MDFKEPIGEAQVSTRIANHYTFTTINRCKRNQIWSAECSRHNETNCRTIFASGTMCYVTSIYSAWTIGGELKCTKITAWRGWIRTPKSVCVLDDACWSVAHENKLAIRCFAVSTAATFEENGSHTEWTAPTTSTILNCATIEGRVCDGGGSQFLIHWKTTTNTSRNRAILEETVSDRGVFTRHLPRDDQEDRPAHVPHNYA
jgi:hypothetical protein